MKLSSPDLYSKYTHYHTFGLFSCKHFARRKVAIAKRLFKKKMLVVSRPAESQMHARMRQLIISRSRDIKIQTAQQGVGVHAPASTACTCCTQLHGWDNDDDVASSLCMIKALSGLFELCFRAKKFAVTVRKIARKPSRWMFYPPK